MDLNIQDNPVSSVAALLAGAGQRLLHLRGGQLDAELLLAHAMDKTRTWLHTWPEKPADNAAIDYFEDLVRRRATGVPLAYLTGTREFWSLPLQVSRHTLVPRPDTERLVELTLEKCADASAIMELGTGCGAVALALASEMPGKHIIATDLCQRALTVARTNARELQLDVKFLCVDWLSGIVDCCLDIVVSNPPYVPTHDEHLAGDGVAFEPALALVGGHDGLDAFRTIAPQAARCLRTGGWLLLEHGHEQGVAVRQIMQRSGLVDATTQPDATGIDRVSVAKKP